MALNFKDIPSAIEIPEPVEPLPDRTVFEEILIQREKLIDRTTRCNPIPLLYKYPKCGTKKYTYRLFYVCSHYKPHYCCKHTGNIILDRDVLTKDEHICHLSQPKKNHAFPRQPSRYYWKRILLPNATARIVQLATPRRRSLEHVIENYGHVLRKTDKEKLLATLEDESCVKFTTIEKMICFIQEEKRLQKVAKKTHSRECRQVQQQILKQQRKQIRRIVCVLFEEMKEFLLNDQFVIDENSALACIIWKEICTFTDCEFITTKNLREYQQIMANNLSVWINKFISNLDIKVQPPEIPERGKYCEQPKSFLPVGDYISLSQLSEEEECDEKMNTPENVEAEYLEEDEFVSEEKPTAL